MQNSEYWEHRFTELEKAQYNNCIKYIDQLKDEYDKALIEIQKDIANWYTRIATNNNVSISTAKRMLNNKELKEFQWTVEEYIKKGEENAINSKWIKELENASARVHIDGLEAIRIQIQNELEHLYDKQSRDVTSFETQQYQNSYYKSAYEIQKGMAMYWKIQALNTNKIEKVMSKPWTTDNKTFSDRIWKNKNELLNTLQKELIQATIRGDSLQQVIDKISKEFNTSKGKAVRLVMTESAFFSSAGQKECFNNLGIEKYKIVATLDSRTSEICRELDGKVFEMKDYQVGITAPPFHCNCRTVTAPYFDDEFTIGEQRAYRDENGNTGYVDSNMKYKEWYEKYVTNSDKNGIISNKLGSTNSNSIGGNGKGQFIEKINTNQINNKLKEYEDDIRNMPIEYAVVIDKDNNVYAYSGSETNININDIELKDCILTHNHPESCSFGEDDYVMLKQNQDIKELRAVDSKYDYSLQILKTLDKPYNYFYKYGLQLSIENKEELQHCIMLELERGIY